MEKAEENPAAAAGEAVEENKEAEVSALIYILIRINN
jgi:hypothetical protein